MCAVTDAATRIRQLDEGWVAALHQRDLDGMLAIYAEDAEELLPDLSPLIGRPAIRAFYRALLAAHPHWRHELWPDRIDVARAGDVAVVRGRYRAQLDPSGPTPASTGKFVGIWMFRDGDWRLTLNISNGDPPAPASAASL